MSEDYLELAEAEEEPMDLETRVWEMSYEYEPDIEVPPDYGIPQDNYLEEQLERERQEELRKMIPNRIP
jgi:hypothetical protein